MKKWLFIFGLMILLATFFDQTIAQMIYDPSAVWADFFYIYGELPSMILTSLAFALLSTIYKRYRFINLSLSLIVGTWAGVQVAHHAGHSLWILAVLALMITLITHALLRKLRLKWIDTYKHHLIIIAWTGLLAWLSPQIIKMIWARPRPYVVFSGEEFQAWYLGFNLTFDNAYKSFPSGHSAVAASLIALCTLKSEMKTKYFRVMTIIVSFYIGLMMLSRMIRGDHYLSDVVFGVMLAGVIYSLCRLFIKKQH